MRQADHQQDGRNHAAEQDCATQPEPACARNRYLPNLPRPAGAECRPDYKQSNAGPEIEHCREQPRFDVAEQNLGERGAGAEEDRRQQGKSSAQPERLSLGFDQSLHVSQSIADRKNRRRPAACSLYRSLTSSL